MSLSYSKIGTFFIESLSIFKDHPYSLTYVTREHFRKVFHENVIMLVKATTYRKHYNSGLPLLGAAPSSTQVSK